MRILTISRPGPPRVGPDGEIRAELHHDAAMHRRRGFLVEFGVSMVVVACWLSPARADVPPPDECGTEGARCDNAGNAYDQPGTCKRSTCSRVTPDGTQTSYDCLRCFPGAPKSAGGRFGCATAAAHDSGVGIFAAGLALAGVLCRRSLRVCGSKST